MSYVDADHDVLIVTLVLKTPFEHNKLLCNVSQSKSKQYIIRVYVTLVASPIQ